MAPHIPAMIENIASILEIEPDQINIKATTEEGLGVTGKGEGISSHVVSMLNSVENYSYYAFDPLEEERNCGGCSGCHKHG